MNCPICGAWSGVLETRPAKHNTIKRRHECANGHRFNTMEVFPACVCSERDLKSNAAKVSRAIDRWKRDIAIRRDYRATAVIAAEHNLTEARIRQIRAAGRTT